MLHAMNFNRARPGLFRAEHAIVLADDALDRVARPSAAIVSIT